MEQQNDSNKKSPPIHPLAPTRQAAAHSSTQPSPARPGSGPIAARPPITPPPGMRPKDLSAAELVKQITSEVSQLAQKQIELAKTELRVNLRDEARMLGGMSIAGLCGIVTLNLLFVTIVLALARVMPAWASGLLVTVVMAAATAIIAKVAWDKRVRSPFARTRRTFQQDVNAVKEGLA